MSWTKDFGRPLILFYFEEFSYRDIAEQMELPIGTVMSRLARAEGVLAGEAPPRRLGGFPGRRWPQEPDRPDGLPESATPREGSRVT